MRQITILVFLLSLTMLIVTACRRPYAGEQTWDEDFVASISATGKPLVFVVKVAKVNPKVDKQIVTSMGGLSFAVQNSAGKALLQGKDFRVLPALEEDPQRDERLREIAEETVELMRKAQAGKIDSNSAASRISALNREFCALQQPSMSEPELVSSLAYKLRLHPLNMPSGKYTITPDVRIVESGKDAISGINNNFGSVNVPAVNSVTVSIP